MENRTVPVIHAEKPFLKKKAFAGLRECFAAPGKEEAQKTGAF